MNGNKLIEEFYMDENEQGRADDFSTNVTLRMSLASATLLNAVAARFETSRYKLTESSLNQFAKDAFASLNEDDKKSIAEAADKEMTEILLKKGATIKSVGMAGEFDNEWSVWREEIAFLEKYGKGSEK